MFQSTRSSYTVTDTAAVLQGIAPDGGLFVDPDIFSRPFDVEGCLSLPYTGMAARIFSHLLPGFASKADKIAAVYPSKFSDHLRTGEREYKRNHFHSHRYLRRYRQGCTGRLSRCRRDGYHRFLPLQRRIRHAEGSDGHAGGQQCARLRRARKL